MANRLASTRASTNRAGEREARFYKGKNSSDGYVDVEKLDVSDEFLSKASLWTSFYRQYPFIFAEHFLGIKLEMFQKIILYGMFHSENYCFIASRGIGKTWMTSVALICRAVLYPNTKIVISAGKKRQSLEVINYIKALADESEALRRSIRYISDSITDAKVEFRGGSTIKIAIAHENARGQRCNLLVLDEFRMIDKNIYDTVLRQFSSDRRKPKFLNKPEYKDYPREENREFLLTSAYYCHHWAYDKFKDYFEQMVVNKKKEYFLVDLPYQISVKVGLKSQQQIANMMAENTFNATTWAMEMEGKWIGSLADAFFRYENLEPCRKLMKPFYTSEIAELLNTKTKKFIDMKKNAELGEVRVLFADIALMSGEENDATIIGLMRLIPQQQQIGGTITRYYMREISYMESIVGGRTDDQAIIIRRLFEEFKCDYLVIDGRGGGVNVFDEISKPLVDPNSGVEYSTPLNAMNYEKFQERCNYPNAKKCVYVINATSQLNSDIAINMQDVIAKRRIKFLISETDAKEVFENIKEYNDFPHDVKGKIMEQYLQANALLNEMINLKKVENDMGMIKLVEPKRTARKDRYSAVSYAVYFSSVLEKELTRDSNFYDDEDDIIYYYN